MNILTISQPFDEIIPHVDEVKKTLKHFLEVQWDFMKDINNQTLMDKVTEWEKKLQESAVSLIKEAAKIKAEV